MTKKLFAVIIVVVVVIAVTLFGVIIMPFWNSIVVTTNASMSSHNLTNYPGSQGAVLSFPLLLVVIPVVAGGILVVSILVKRNRERRSG